MYNPRIEHIAPEQAETNEAAPPVAGMRQGHETAASSEQSASMAPAAYPPPPPQSRRLGRRRFWTALLIALILLLVVAGSLGGGILGARLVPATATAPTSSGSSVNLSASVADMQQAVENVSQGVQPSVVEIMARRSGTNQEATGSGIILMKDGYIATNDHVVRLFNTYSVTLSNGQELPAQLVGEAAQDDLAVLKVTANNLAPMTFADSSTVKVGQFAVVVGAPLGLEQSATFGIVSALNRTVSESPDGPAAELAGMVQTDASINPGNSGGALVDLQGRFVGMPTLTAGPTSDGTDTDGIGFAIPADRVAYVTAQLIQHGRLVNSGQGFLGVQGQDVGPQLAAAQGLSVQSGVLVEGFTNATSGNSPAQQADVQVGDVITAVDGESITGTDDLASAILPQSPGTRVTLAIWRGAQQRAVAVPLGERPVSA